MCQPRFAECLESGVPAHAPGRSIIFSNNVLLVIADIILKRVTNRDISLSIQPSLEFQQP